MWGAALSIQLSTRRFSGSMPSFAGMEGCLSVLAAWDVAWPWAWNLAWQVAKLLPDVGALAERRSRFGLGATFLPLAGAIARAERSEA